MTACTIANMPMRKINVFQSISLRTCSIGSTCALETTSRASDAPTMATAGGTTSTGNCSPTRNSTIITPSTSERHDGKDGACERLELKSRRHAPVTRHDVAHDARDERNQHQDHEQAAEAHPLQVLCEGHPDRATHENGALAAEVALEHLAIVPDTVDDPHHPVVTDA